MTEDNRGEANDKTDPDHARHSGASETWLATEVDASLTTEEQSVYEPTPVDTAVEGRDDQPLMRSVDSMEKDWRAEDFIEDDDADGMNPTRELPREQFAGVDKRHRPAGLRFMAFTMPDFSAMKPEGRDDQTNESGQPESSPRPVKRESLLMQVFMTLVIALVTAVVVVGGVKTYEALRKAPVPNHVAPVISTTPAEPTPAVTRVPEARTSASASASATLPRPSSSPSPSPKPPRQNKPDQDPFTPLIDSF